MPPAKTLNVIGCGSVGRTLARLWHDRGVFEIGSVLNRSLESARRAVEFVGAGRPIERFSQLAPADAVMISTDDEAIEACCRRLAETSTAGPGVVVFHCSGSLTSGLLKPVRVGGAAVASIHPVKSFADAARSVESFEGTFCAMEGGDAACELLGNALEQVGARLFAVDPEFKTIYHAATVIVSNYLVALTEVGLQCFEKAGIDRTKAQEVIAPIVTGTLENVLALGPTGALTGPIARGEPSVVARQCRALAEWDAAPAEVYRALGQEAVELAEAQGRASPDALAAIRQALRGIGKTR